jgi:hypothetical protein
MSGYLCAEAYQVHTNAGYKPMVIKCSWHLELLGTTCDHAANRTYRGDNPCHRQRPDSSSNVRATWQVRTLPGDGTGLLRT